MDNLVSILKMPVLNMDVKNRILKLVQNWAMAFEGKPSLYYVGQVHKTLKSEGVLPTLLNVFDQVELGARVQLSAAGSCCVHF